MNNVDLPCVPEAPCHYSAAEASAWESGYESALDAAAGAQNTPRPTYYVRHPNGSFSIAVPQPTEAEIAEQREYVYAQCDRKHAGSCCEDPQCYRGTPK